MGVMGVMGVMGTRHNGRISIRIWPQPVGAAFDPQARVDRRTQTTASDSRASTVGRAEVAGETGGEA